MKFKLLFSYLAITFGITWGIAILLIMFSEPLVSIFGELDLGNPLFMLAVYSPAIAAFILIIKNYGIRGFKKYLSRLLLWKAPIGWYVFILIGIPVLFYLGATLKGNLWSNPFPFSIWYQAIPAILFMLILGPIEEFGWRGVALPLLQRRFAPIWAALILGIIWGLWHLPAFYLSGTMQSEWSFLPFFIASIAISIIVTPLFNVSKGSLLLPILFHWQLINPIFPDAAPHDTTVFVIAAIIIVTIYRKELFNQDGAVVDVIPRNENN